MIYRLERTGKILPGEIQRMIVRASQEKIARETAAANSGKEGRLVWLNKIGSECEIIEEMGKPEIIDSVEAW